MTCPFCDLDYLRPRILEDRPKTIVFFSDPRLMPGHLLVIPKRHVEHLADLAADERAELFDMAIEMQARVIGCIAGGCDISQHDRPFITQSRLKIDHVHIHIRPRDPYDDFHRATRESDSLFQELMEEEVMRVRAKLDHFPE